MSKSSFAIICGLAAIICATTMTAPADDAAVTRKPYISTWMAFTSWDKEFREIYGKSLPVPEIIGALADAGVTDLYFGHQTRPGNFLDRHSQFQASRRVPADRDLLEEVLTAADQHQMRVWLLQTPKIMSADFIAQELEPVFPGIRLSLINDGLRRFFHDMIDGVAAHYRQHPSLAGFSWHELNGVAGHQLRKDPSLVAEFKRFARERYQADYPDDVIPAVDAESVWWRRFYRFHLHTMSDFIKDMSEYARRHKLRSDFVFYTPESASRESWSWAYDILELEQHVDQMWFVGRNESGKFYYHIRGGVADFGPSYGGQNLLNNYSYTFHGLPLGYWEGKRPMWVNPQDAYTASQKGVDLCFGKELYPKWLNLMAAWQGGASPARVAMAIAPHPFIMRYPHAPGIEYRAKITDLLQALGRHVDVDGFITGSQAMPENLKTYRCVILPEDMSMYLDAKSYELYHDYVKQGGHLLVINSPVTIARDDLTEPRDKTTELCGVRLKAKSIPGFIALESDALAVPTNKFWGAVYEIEPAGAQTLAQRKHTGEPVLTRYQLGAGAVYFSAVSANPDAAAFFADIICQATPCPITMKNSSGIAIRESVRKHDLLGITLWGKGAGLLRVDLPAIGIDAPEYEVRDAITGRLLREKISADELRQGLPVENVYADQLTLAVIAPAGQTAAFTGIVKDAEAFKELEQKNIRLIENPEVPIDVPPGDGARIGVYYNGLGAAPIIAALNAQGGRVFSLPRLDAQSFKHADIVIIPQMRGKNVTLFNQALDELRAYVDNGGGVLLTHDAVGYRGHQPAFPEIGKGLLNPVSLEIYDKVTVTTEHPVTAGFDTGAQFTHAFFDHVTITSGAQGTVLIKDERDMAVVAAGAFGKGRVVLNGMLPGYASRERGSRDAADRPMEGGELQLLLNAVKWLADGK